MKFSLSSLNCVPRHEDVWVIEGIASPFFTSIPDGGEWSASHPCRVIPVKTAPCTHCIGGWVGLRAGLDAVE
jgi:hypothetical protein